MKCAEVKEILPAHVREPEPSLALRRHLSSCADCRAELESYETMIGGLASLRSVAVEPPPHLKAALVAIPAEAGRLEAARRNVAAARTHVARNRRAYAGGLAVAALGVGAALWRSRVRHPAVA